MNMNPPNEAEKKKKKKKKKNRKGKNLNAPVQVDNRHSDQLGVIANTNQEQEINACSALEINKSGEIDNSDSNRLDMNVDTNQQQEINTCSAVALEQEINEPGCDIKGGVCVIRYLVRNCSIDFTDNNKILSDDEKRSATIALQGLKVGLRHRMCGKKFCIRGLTQQKTEEITFVEKSGVTTRLLDYFYRKYNCAIKYQKLPCLDLGMTTHLSPIFVPMELCAVYDKDNPSSRAQTRPGEKLYPDCKSLEKKWFILFCGKDPPCASTLEKFRQALVHNCGESIIFQKDDFLVHISDVRYLRERVSEVQKKCEGKLKILVCVMDTMDEKRPTFYRDLKQIIEVEKNLLTQCCQLQYVDNYCALYEPDDLLKTAYVVNLALEMNAKVGADRNRILLLRSPLPPERFGNCKVMYVGLHLIHGSYPSVAAVVGSTADSDRTTVYKSAIKKQNDCSEQSIQELGKMLRELLGEYKKVNQSLPDKILFFRNASTGGLIEKDVSVLKDVLKNEEPSSHNSQTEGGKFRNLPMRMSFIVAHKNSFPGGIRSVNFGKTSKANYSLFSDENGITPSDLQTLIENLCHTSERCTKPLPLYYAHVAAQRARQYLLAKNDNDMNKIQNAIDRSLFVCGRPEAMENTQLQDRQMEQLQDQQMVQVENQQMQE